MEGGEDTKWPILVSVAMKKNKSEKVSIFKIGSKSIKARILSGSVSIILVSILLTTAISALLNLYAANVAAQTSFEQIVNASALQVESEMTMKRALINEIAGNTLFQESTISDPYVSEFLKAKAEEHGFKNIYFTDTSGNSNVRASFIAYEFFIEASKGNIYMSAPQVSADGTYADIMLASPVRDHETGKVVGTICAVYDSYILSEMLGDITIGETGTLYIIDSEGYTIADPKNYEYVLARENTIQQSKDDPSLLAFAQYESQALKGVPVFGEMTYEGTKCFMAAIPIEGTNGWVLGGYAPTAEFLATSMNSAILTGLVGVVMVVISAIIMYTVAKKISKPIVDISAVSSEVAKGNFNVSVEYRSQDEIGVMADNFREMIQNNGDIIRDASRVLGEVSNGNLTVNTDRSVNYCGDFADIETAINTIIESLNGIVFVLKNTSTNVTSGSEQVSSGAMSLSQGSQEQAAAVEELAASMQDISSQVDDTAENAAHAKDLAATVKDGILVSNESMNALNDAIKQIEQKQDEIKQIVKTIDDIALLEQKQDEIKQIVKTIDDIALQTNILSLNASVEAARAGAAGKGFAVVASEVRSLAQKVGEAAKITTDLISANDVVVGKGAQIASNTSNNLHKVVKDTLVVVDKINEISDACVEQAARLDEAAIGIEQVSSVVQSNSATAEECAAISESMNKQALGLEGIVQRFTLGKLPDDIHQHIG